MGFIGDVGDVLKSIVKYGSGNDLVGSMARNNNVTDTLVDVSKTLQQREAIKRFNRAGITAANDLSAGARTIAKGSKVSANNYAELDALMKDAGVLGALKSDVRSGIEMGMGSAMNEAELAAYLGRKNGSIGYFNTAKGYFLDEEFGKTRRQVVAGGAVAGGIGIRYLQGGNLTTTAQGERDIAGIPFI